MNAGRDDGLGTAAGEPASQTAPEGSSAGFQFDLGGALHRLGEASGQLERRGADPARRLDPPPAGGPELGTLRPPIPPGPPAPPAPPAVERRVGGERRSTPPRDLWSDRRAPTPVVATPHDDAAPLPPIREATPLPGDGPRLVLSAAVGLGAADPAPSLSARPLNASSSDPTLASASPVSPTPSGAVGVLDAAPSLPPISLPLAVPAPAMPVPQHAQVAPTFTPTVVRRKESRHLFAKFLAALVVLGALIAAALVFGRPYLFPDEWDRETVALVDELTLATGLEFDDPVPLLGLTDTEFRARAIAHVAGDTAPAELLARWRALGLAPSAVDEVVLGDALATWMPAFYDAERGEIVHLASLDGPAAERMYGEALAEALLDQRFEVAEDAVGRSLIGTPLAGAVEVNAMLDRLVEVVAATDDAITGRSLVAALPSPVSYSILAADGLGPALFEATTVNPARTDPAPAAAEIADRVAVTPEVEPRRAPAATLASGDAMAGDAEPLSRDDWFLVFASRLPGDTATVLADSIDASLLTPTLRGTTVCVYATFTAANPDALAALEFAMPAWTAAAPVEAAATFELRADGSIQVVSCDPAGAAGAPRAESSTELMAQQVARVAPAG